MVQRDMVQLTISILFHDGGLLMLIYIHRRDLRIEDLRGFNIAAKLQAPSLHLVI